MGVIGKCEFTLGVQIQYIKNGVCLAAISADAKYAYLKNLGVTQLGGDGGVWVGGIPTQTPPLAP